MNPIVIPGAPAGPPSLDTRAPAKDPSEDGAFDLALGLALAPQSRASNGQPGVASGNAGHGVHGATTEGAQAEGAAVQTLGALASESAAIATGLARPNGSAPVPGGGVLESGAVPSPADPGAAVEGAGARSLAGAVRLPDSAGRPLPGPAPVPEPVVPSAPGASARVVAVAAGAAAPAVAPAASLAETAVAAATRRENSGPSRETGAGITRPAVEPGLRSEGGGDVAVGPRAPVAFRGATSLAATVGREAAGHEAPQGIVESLARDSGAGVTRENTIVTRESAAGAAREPGMTISRDGAAMARAAAAAIARGSMAPSSHDLAWPGGDARPGGRAATPRAHEPSTARQQGARSPLEPQARGDRLGGERAAMESRGASTGEPAPAAPRAEPAPASPAAGAPATESARAGGGTGGAPQATPGGAGVGFDALDRFAALRRPGDQVTLRLEGENGIEGRLRVALRGQSLRATIVSADPRATQRLGSEIGELQRALTERGFPGAQVAVQQARGGEAFQPRPEAQSGSRDEGRESQRQRDDENPRTPDDRPQRHPQRRNQER